MLTLPNELQQAIQQALTHVPEARWLHAAQALSERYRGPRDSAPLATGDIQALGYLALIMPATYAQLHGAIAAAAARIPNWQPHSLLDLGSGPGTALWAAAAQWPTLDQFSAWEREPAFITLGKQLAQHSTAPAVRQTRWTQHDLRQTAPQGQYDLVILGHVLNELDDAAQAKTVQAAWSMTAGMLLIVEPGTLAAFALVRHARDRLLDAGAHTIAPCAHDRPCPLEADWCHFPQRLRRPDFQRKARGAPSEWEDSKWSYAALARFTPETAIWGRVIREPTWNKAYADVRISATDGIHDRCALKRHRDAFKQVKALEWGAALADPLDEFSGEARSQELGVKSEE